MIEIEQLSKRHRASAKPALDDVSFSVARGSIHGLLGPNGAGKSTLMNLLCGLLKPDSGSLRIAGFDVASQPQQVRRLIGYVPQSLAFYPTLTVAENLALFARLRCASAAQQQQCVDTAQLSAHLKKPAHQLSGGLQRRLNLALGLLGTPQLLLLDEPTVGVDPQSRHYLLNTLQTLAAGGLTILYATHYMDEVSRLCKEVTVLDAGRVVAEGSPQELAPDGDLEALFLRRTGTALRDS